MVVGVDSNFGHRVDNMRSIDLAFVSGVPTMLACCSYCAANS